MDRKKILTICPYCGCGCQLYLTTDKTQKEIIEVIPSLSNPINRGSLCIKGWHISEVFSSDNRIKKPLIKTNGSLKETTWKEALDLVSNKFNSIKNKDKSFGIIGSAKTTNEDNYVLFKFAREVMKTNNIDSSFTLHYKPLIEKLNNCNFSITMDDIENSDLIIVIGANLHIESPQIVRRVLKSFDKGAKIIVINTIKVPLSNLAHIYIQPDPSEYSILINALGKIISEVSNGKMGKNSNLEKIANYYIHSKNPVCICGEDIFKGVDPKSSFSSIFNVFGNRLFPLFTVNNILGAVSYGVSPYISDKKGYNIIEMLDIAHSGTLKCLYIIGEDILITAGDYNKTKSALEKLEFLVVQDLFLTETAKLADVVLPACSSLEKKGTFINMEGKVQEIEPVIEPIGEAKPDWRIFVELSESIGIKLPYSNVGEISKEIKTINFLRDKKYINTEISIPNEVVSNEFPLWVKINNPCLFFHSGSLLKNSYTLMREMEAPVVVVNLRYAKENNLRNNERIKIVSKRGEIIRNVSISEEIPENVLIITSNLNDFSGNTILPFGLKWTSARLEKIK